MKCLLLLLLCLKCIEAMNMREMFHQSFDDRCRKYSFVEEYLANLKKPSNRFLIFVYHEKGLKNGGFGDRLGGLLTAFAHAIRFKRTLLMKASNGFYDYFQNYHPHNNTAYSWENWRDWSGYQVWKDKHPEFTSNNRELWEYDLSSCVSNWEEKFPESVSRRCAMDDGDVFHPVIRMASNRAYFCRWQNRTDLPSHSLALSALNLENAGDLWEASGCILRLLMWPTDRLWQEVDQAYFDLLTESRDLFPQFHNNLADGKKEQKSELKSKLKVIKEVVEEAAEDEYEFSTFHQSADNLSKEAEEDVPQQTRKKDKKKKSKNKNNNNKSKKNSKKNKKTKKYDDHHRELRSVDNTVSVLDTVQVPSYLTLEANAYYQLGLHFRCGDIWSYRHLKLHSYGESTDGCTTSDIDMSRAEDIIEDIKKNPDQKSQYLRAGFPLAIGTCARHWIDQGTLSTKPLLKSYVQVELVEDENFKGANSLLAGKNLEYLEFYDAYAPYHTPTHDENNKMNKKLKSTKTTGNNIDDMKSKYLVFITADNVYAAQQMRDPIWRGGREVEYLPVVVTPQGKQTACHCDFIALCTAVCCTCIKSLFLMTYAGP